VPCHPRQVVDVQDTEDRKDGWGFEEEEKPFAQAAWSRKKDPRLILAGAKPEGASWETCSHIFLFRLASFLLEG